MSDVAEPLYVFTNGHEGWVAKSPEDVLSIYKEWTGLDYDPEEGDYPWEPIPDDQIIKIGSEEEMAHDTPPTAALERKNGYYLYSAKASEWAATNGRGFLFADEW